MFLRNGGEGMNFFLRHFAGFLIQIGASMLLCLIPFRAEDFSYQFLGSPENVFLYSEIFDKYVHRNMQNSD